MRLLQNLYGYQSSFHMEVSVTLHRLCQEQLLQIQRAELNTFSLHHISWGRVSDLQIGVPSSLSVQDGTLR